jgi:hypothetical protein
MNGGICASRVAPEKSLPSFGRENHSLFQPLRDGVIYSLTLTNGKFFNMARIKTTKKEKSFTMRQIAKAWKAQYGESMREEYPGFWNSLKEKKSLRVK